MHPGRGGQWGCWAEPRLRRAPCVFQGSAGALKFSKDPHFHLALGPAHYRTGSGKGGYAQLAQPGLSERETPTGWFCV